MTAPDPRDGALDPRAVEAAAEALRLAFLPNVPPRGVIDRIAPAALTAAAPFLRAEGAAAERQRIAAAIRGLRVVSIADRAVLGNGDWRLRSSADNARLVAEAVRDAAARIVEADPGTAEVTP